MTLSVNQDFEEPGISVPDQIGTLDCWTSTPGCTAQFGDCGPGLQWAVVDARQGMSFQSMTREMPTAERTSFDLNYNIDVGGTEPALFLISCDGGGFLVTIEFDPNTGLATVLDPGGLSTNLQPCAAVQVTGTFGSQLVVNYAGIQLASFPWPASCTEAISFTWEGSPNKGELGSLFRVDNVTTSVPPMPTLGMTYCDVENNSTGGPSLISADGSAVTSLNDVELRMVNMPRFAFGFFIVSQTRGFVANPAGSSGNLCLGGFIGRYVGPGQIMNSGSQGEIALQIDLTAIPQPNGSTAVMPGDTWNFQGWHRDLPPAGTSQVSGTNFSAGLEIMFQ